MAAKYAREARNLQAQVARLRAKLAGIGVDAGGSAPKISAPELTTKRALASAQASIRRFRAASLTLASPEGMTLKLVAEIKRAQRYANTRIRRHEAKLAKRDAARAAREGAPLPRQIIKRETPQYKRVEFRSAAEALSYLRRVRGAYKRSLAVTDAQLKANVLTALGDSMSAPSYVGDGNASIIDFMRTLPPADVAYLVAIGLDNAFRYDDRHAGTRMDEQDVVDIIRDAPSISARYDQYIQQRAAAESYIEADFEDFMG